PSSANHLASESRTLSSSSTISNLPLITSLPLFLLHSGEPAIGLAGQRRPLAVNRQMNCETGSSSWQRVDGYAASVALHNVLADGQAKSGSARFLAGVERLEDVGQMFVRDAHTVVANN